MHSFLQGLKPTLHISHRGGAAIAPENTMPAFEIAVLRYGTDMIETDVHLTRDGAVVIAHDETLERCTDGTGPISSYSLRELLELDAGYRFSADGLTFPERGKDIRIPLLSELLQRFPQMRLNIELKAGDQGAVDIFVAELKKYDAVGRVCIGSEHDRIGELLVRSLPEACHFYPRDALTRVVMGMHAGAPTAGDDPYSVLDMPLYYEGIRLIHEEFLKRVRAIGRWVNVWVIDEPEEMRDLVRAGVGGIMTDYPDRLRSVLNEHSAK